MATLTEYRSLVTTLSEQVAEVEQSRKASTDAPEVKVGRLARQLVAQAGTAFGTDTEGVVNLAEYLRPIMALGPTVVDTTTGQSTADKLGALLKVHELGLADDNFAKVAEEAKAAVDAWASLTTRKRGERGAESTTPASQLLATFGIDSVTLTMSHNGEQVKAITHGSTWSSLSDQVNRAYKLVTLGAEDAVTDGSVSYGKADPEARKAWREAVKAWQAGPDQDTGTFSVDCGEKGALTVAWQVNRPTTTDREAAKADTEAAA